MKINHVLIDNWEEPGAAWWNRVEAHPDSPLIEASLKLTLSYNEYRQLLLLNEKPEGVFGAKETVQ